MLRHRHVQLCLLLAVLLLSSACGPSDPAAKVAATRAEYTIQLNTFIVQEPEQVEPMMDTELEGEAVSEAIAEEAAVAVEAVSGEAEEEGAEGEVDEVEAGPKTTDVLLDLLLYFNGTDSLPGVTIEVSMADPFEKEKATFRRYLETGKMVRGEGRQETLMLEGIENFETGDVFSVFIRPSVPTEEQGEYPEFATPGS